MPGLVVWSAWGGEAGLGTGTLPQGSGEQAETCQALDTKAQDRLLQAGGGQADPDAFPEPLDTGGDLDRAQADGLDLGGAPGCALGRAPRESPPQPIRRGVEQ